MAHMKTFTKLLSESVTQLNEVDEFGSKYVRDRADQLGISMPIGGEIMYPGRGQGLQAFVGSRPLSGRSDMAGTNAKLEQIASTARPNLAARMFGALRSPKHAPRRGSTMPKPVPPSHRPMRGTTVDSKLKQAQRRLAGKLLVPTGIATILAGAYEGAIWVIKNPREAAKAAYAVTDSAFDYAVARILKDLGFSDEQILWVQDNSGKIMAGIAATGIAAAQAPKLLGSIKSMAKNRRIMKEIKVALDVGDEELARTIMIDAIEDEGVSLSTIKRKLTAGQFDQLMR